MQYTIVIHRTALMHKLSIRTKHEGVSKAALKEICPSLLARLFNEIFDTNHIPRFSKFLWHQLVGYYCRLSSHLHSPV